MATKKQKIHRTPERPPPRGWERKSGYSSYEGEGLRFGITNHHIYHPGAWVLWCDELGVKNRVLRPKEDTREAAEQAGLEVLEGLLLDISSALAKALASR